MALPLLARLVVPVIYMCVCIRGSNSITHPHSHVATILHQVGMPRKGFDDRHGPLTVLHNLACEEGYRHAGHRLVISLLVGEPSPIILNAILNVLNFTTSSTLVVLHINARLTVSSAEDLQIFSSLMPHTLSCRFILNHVRLPVYTNHGSILTGHMLNYAYVKDKGLKFDSFMFMASNMRFFRCGVELPTQTYNSTVDMKHARGKGCVVWAGNSFHPELWELDGVWKVFYNMTASQALDTFNATRPLVMNWAYHEGFFASSSILEAFYSLLAERNGFAYLIETPYCAEEYWLPTFISMMHSTPALETCTSLSRATSWKCIGDSLTWVKLKPGCVNCWNTSNFVEEALAKPLPHNYYAIKRVARNLSDPLAMLLADMGANAQC